MEDNLYGWIFTFNPFTKNWRACKREDYLKFFDFPETDFLRSEYIEDLIALVIKTQGDDEKIKKLLKNEKNKTNYQNSN